MDLTPMWRCRVGQSGRNKNACHLASNLTCQVTVQCQESERRPTRIRCPFRTTRSESDGESILVGRRWSARDFGLAGLAALWVGTGGCRWSALAHPTS